MTDVLKSLKYTFTIYSHPFDGFWFMKSQKKATAKTGIVILFLLLVTTSIRIYTTGYILSSISLTNFSVWLMMLVIIGVILLYCTANWALTTLLDGKGTFSEIFTSLMYSVSPIVIMNLPMTLISNLISYEGIAFYNFINIVTFAWAVFLLLAANHSIHDFTMTKSVIILLITLIFMLLIIVIGILFINLCQQVYVWIAAIVQEFAYRL